MESKEMNILIFLRKKMINKKLAKVYKGIERSLYRKKPIMGGSEKWDTAYFLGFESGADSALYKLEKEFPELRELAKDKKDGLVYK